MSTRTRGLIVFVGILFVAVVFCGMFPFVILPNMGVGAALPVIEVPGEVITEDFLPGFNLTNTIVGTVLADVILVIFVALAWRASKGWTKEVPNRFQALVEVLIEGFYNFCKGIGGDRLRNAPFLWPLVATIFIFLLAANWMKLLPGVETVGKMHCAYADTSGYAYLPGWTEGSARLWVSEPLNPGFPQDEEGYDLCNQFWDEMHGESFEVEDAETIQANFIAAEQVVAEIGDSEELTEEQEEAQRYAAYGEQRLASANLIVELEDEIESLEADIAALEAEIDASHGEEGEESEEAEATDTDEGEATAEEGEDIVVTDDAATLEDQLAERETRLTELQDELLLAQTQLRYPNATLALTEEELEAGVIPFIHHITPFVRGAATDLSLAFALAIMSIFLVQVYGVWALGPAYFDKFINIPALGNLGKKPLGAIDFVVGLIEIISEIGKIISLAFRLFGNLFAGGVALMAVTFLVSLLVPTIIYGLEIIIGSVQALVFAVLTLVFAVQAMEAHHGDDHEHGEEHH